MYVYVAAERSRSRLYIRRYFNVVPDFVTFSSLCDQLDGKAGIIIGQ